MAVEKHQLAGFDDRARGFNRVVEIEQAGTGYMAILRYEQAVITADGNNSGTAALQSLVQRLHSQGYAQLRSQMSFHGSTYLGTKEPWIEYPDPNQPSLLSRLLDKLFG